MARILLLTLVFPPDSVSTSILLKDLALELKALGHKITVLTTTPHYNTDTEASALQPLRPNWGRLLFKSDFNGSPVYHASVPIKGNRVGTRLLDYIRFHAISTIAGLTLAIEYDVIIAPSPPLTVGLSAWVLGMMHRVPFIYNVQEIYPDIAVSLGVIRNRHIIRIMEWLERFIYARSRIVVVISEWFRRRLLDKGVPAHKLCVISNFVDTDFMRPMDRNNSFSAAHGFDDQFVVLYAGNIGLTQGFETVLSAAKRLAHLINIRFLVVGDGARRGWLEEELKEENLPNFTLLPYQPRSLVPQVYGVSDICLVPLKGGTAQETFPSKIYTIMAAGRPAIVAADQDSELAWVTEESGCGWAVPPDDDQALAEAIERAYHKRSELKQKGKFGREYVVEHHSRQVIARQYDRVIQDLVYGN